MFRRRVTLRKPRVYAELFEYNRVLHSVFSAPGSKIAIAVERPGEPRQQHTYRQLQQDVIALADTLVAKLGAENAVEGRKWLQPPRPDHIQSLFHVDAEWKSSGGPGAPRQYSCDALADDGRYNATFLCHPGYEYVVTLLAYWALNLNAVPLCPLHKYDGEMSYTLQHSQSTLLVSEAQLANQKLPESFAKLSSSSSPRVTSLSPLDANSTFAVQATLDVSSWLTDTHWSRQQGGTLTASDPLPAEVTREPIRTAEDVLRRIETDKARHQASLDLAREEASMDEFLRLNRKAGDSKDAAPLTFDDASLASLNPIFRKRFEKDARYCPTPHDDCLMIYTSGTTAKPKGVVHTHRSACNQVQSLQTAWRWTSEDVILNTLPLHHVHGLVNMLLCALASQATCIFTPFDHPKRICDRLMEGDISLFMAVPTIYSKLIETTTRQFTPIEKTAWRKSVSQNIRLMVSGSAALPVPTLQRFHDVSGHVLLERYGMTEVGMALSQPYAPLDERLPGTVGQPLPTVEVMIQPFKADENGEIPSTKLDDPQLTVESSGLLALRSSSVFDRYWANPAATQKELVVCPKTKKHFFDTGDSVARVVRTLPPSTTRSSSVPSYVILGRTSVDILKCRGYKLSAIEIEAGVLAVKGLAAEVAVVGIPHESLGEQIVAVVSVAPGFLEACGCAAKDLEGIPKQGVRIGVVPASSGNSGNTATAPPLPSWAEEAAQRLRTAATSHLAPYKVPTGFVLLVDPIPRNAMGKVNKKSLKIQLGL
mmetsp:Transcript_19953/g.22950  ORF Transcript_19953/g.22950 Transcript_19953/m.22950 type:complete len:765 (-) Transcript_19953:257-2551(-)